MQQMAQMDATPTDEEAEPLEHWMERYQAGEMAAFERLYSALASPITRYVRRLASPGIEVADLVQNTFLQIHRARASYLPGHPVRPWVYAIARHMVLMARRTRRRSTGKETSIDDEVLELPAPATAQSDPVDQLTLASALRTLPDPGREALWLHHVEGLSFREVAAVQGIRETAAKVRAHRALVVLRARYAAAGKPS